MSHGHFGDLLSERIKALGHDKHEDTLAYLRRRGVDMSDSCLSSYLHGARRPRPGRMEAILDAFDVHGDDRLTAYRLAAGSQSDDEGA